MQQASSKRHTVIKYSGGKGHAQHLNAYTSVKSESFCAFKAARNLHDVIAITIHTIKNEEDVIETSQV